LCFRYNLNFSFGHRCVAVDGCLAPVLTLFWEHKKVFTDGTAQCSLLLTPLSDTRRFRYFVCVVAVFSLPSGQVHQQPLGPCFGRPRRNRQGNSVVRAHREEGDKGILAQARGRKGPKAQLDCPVDTTGRPRPPLKSPNGDPLVGSQRANTCQHPRPIVFGWRGLAGRPLLGPNPPMYMEENNPRDPVARPPMGANQCGPPSVREASPSKQCEIQARKNPVPQPPPSAAKMSKSTLNNHRVPSPPRTVRSTRPK